jgi:hypothetical protein
MILTDTLRPDTVRLADDSRTRSVLSAQEDRERSRALNGLVLRQKVYALGDYDSAHGEAFGGFLTTQIPPWNRSSLCGGNGDRPWRLSPLCRQAVNFVHDGQTCLPSLLGFPTDPRLSHSIILVVDGFGIGLCTGQQLTGCREENPIRLLMPDDLDIQKRQSHPCVGPPSPVIEDTATEPSGNTVRKSAHQLFKLVLHDQGPGSHQPASLRWQAASRSEIGRAGLEAMW